MSRVVAALLIALLGSSTAFAQVATRNDIALFHYAGEPSYVEQFDSFLEATTLALASTFADESLIVSQLDVGQLRVVPHPDHGPVNYAAMLEYWKKTSSLALFRGWITRDQSTTTVQSQIFLGDYHGSLPTLLALRLDLTAKSAATAKDSHTLAILYALAEKAQREGRPQPVVSAYWRRAYDVATDLKRSLPKKPGGSAPPDHLTQLCDTVIAAVNKKPTP